MLFYFIYYIYSIVYILLYIYHAYQNDSKCLIFLKRGGNKQSELMAFDGFGGLHGNGGPKFEKQPKL